MPEVQTKPVVRFALFEMPTDASLWASVPQFGIGPGFDWCVGGTAAWYNKEAAEMFPGDPEEKAKAELKEEILRPSPPRALPAGTKSLAWRRERFCFFVNLFVPVGRVELPSQLYEGHALPLSYTGSFSSHILYTKPFIKPSKTK